MYWKKFIEGSNAAFLMVSHDRRFLRNATSRIIELMGGDQGMRQYGLGYDEYVEAREKARQATFNRYEQYEKRKRSDLIVLRGQHGLRQIPLDQTAQILTTISSRLIFVKKKPQSGLGKRSQRA